MEIVRYNPVYSAEWDDFVGKSKNGTFLFMRHYMDYHADRFADHSLMFYQEGKLVALLPANEADSVLYSHQGLTYGGFILSVHNSAVQVLALMDILLQYLREHDFVRLVYKCIPHIYHRYPAEEDLYALFRKEARLMVRNLATVVPTKKMMKSSRLKRAKKRAEKESLRVEECGDAAIFWKIIEDDRWEQHGVKPLHTKEEMNLLHGYFPENIRFFLVKDAFENIFAGSVIYDSNIVTHLQYAAATREGKDIYATDVLYYELINSLFPENEYFDFGTSNENAGWYLNFGMSAHKEEFGGRGIAYDIYEINI